jgi:hypothetical protein
MMEDIVVKLGKEGDVMTMNSKDKELRALLVELVERAVNECYGDDGDKQLIDSAQERASVARIYWRMQNLIDNDEKYSKFRDYNLDCEYYRREEARPGTDRKNYINSKEEEHYARPDIILHERGDNTGNLLVIEFKSQSSGTDKKDVEKLKALTSSQYNYKLGLAIELNVPKAEYRYFQNGSEVKEEE